MKVVANKRGMSPEVGVVPKISQRYCAANFRLETPLFKVWLRPCMLCKMPLYSADFFSLKQCTSIQDDLKELLGYLIAMVIRFELHQNNCISKYSDACTTKKNLMHAYPTCQYATVLVCPPSWLKYQISGKQVLHV